MKKNSMKKYQQLIEAEGKPTSQLIMKWISETKHFHLCTYQTKK